MKSERFQHRHIGISAEDEKVMLEKIGVKSLDELIDQTIPQNIRLQGGLKLPEALSEHEYAEEMALMASKNRICASYIGMGWYDTVCPAPIFRNVFENPVWYTSYTPYQAEISQGRLEALMNFQTMVSDLTGLALSNCSLLDEATAGAEAATMMYALRSRDQIKNEVNKLFVDKNIFPQTLAVINTRMAPQGITVVVGDYRTVDMKDGFFGAIIQYPDSNGNITDYTAFARKVHEADCKVAVATDLMALTLLVPPGEWGADIAFGSSQRFGIPMFYGGPSAGFFATKEDYKRNVPGRIIGVSKDAYGKAAYRMALQTREQHIKREKATSNICTAQALLATMAGFYAVYHGPKGLKKIAKRIHSATALIADELKELGYTVLNEQYFDTLKIALPSGVSQYTVRENAEMRDINLRYYEGGEVGISIDETITEYKAHELLAVFSLAVERMKVYMIDDLPEKNTIADNFLRKSEYLQHEVFNLYHTETELMRYIKRLDRKDISLAHSMISLGSCTMKLNAASEMLPLGLGGFQNIHPFAPESQTQGYTELIGELGEYLKEITGFAGISFQPNSGAAGEYAGLMTIRKYQESIGQGHRNIILIPASAHGTNPASAIQAGYETVTIDCDAQGNVVLEDLQAKADLHKDNLAGCMITYPSTHGIFEKEIKEMCKVVHERGGQVYMDGANMNAQVGLTNPGFIGADVCHLNLHKTFAIPHGGGGPGEGPICVAEHLVPFLPHHPELDGSTVNTVASSPYGSAGILPITYGYIRMMGGEGLTHATKIAILNANYLAECFKDTYGIVYRGTTGRVGHELILECRKVKDASGITESDIAKRLMDYGYHAPTLSFPVHGTLMIEPTESESLAELNRFVDTMNQIWQEIKEVENGTYTKEDNVLVNAPHPEYEICADEWGHAYPRSKAAYPLEFVKQNKFWINVARVDNAYGDRNLITCLCDMG
ncbi:glycine dehydrogenase [Dysgonomonas sp. PFB1-18]|uniref:aminomethyl-transferring glycine dehydrogenase n=1 Tax=unclassified Dysgonomonas TaxID=2630389 RepID=UPI00247589E0|nr:MULTISPECIES: aminomethyl-transferring glycine dehydrogenase [unclassified Dysgonomonas]MDH6308189.1 glycine dehydrogenase [Dysgonomonas sp. PF1-14]MDH6338372.1 glycine dehydrogenase [Dysgonomonas sp. PF1-16]MDH6379869.1 glycine dehydrogenase [Dysgonomonas sp. PFB1-18]MDH6397041.1 glycine dehydrogenase [Dysgonomonas sp. PF1-23]